MPVKKRNSKLFLERLKPGGHVRLHRIQLDGCSRNDACLGNGGKYLEISYIHEILGHMGGTGARPVAAAP
jgi:hypothetical protein